MADRVAPIEAGRVTMAINCKFRVEALGAFPAWKFPVSSCSSLSAYPSKENPTLLLPTLTQMNTHTLETTKDHDDKPGTLENPKRETSLVDHHHRAQPSP